MDANVPKEMMAVQASNKIDWMYEHINSQD